MVEWPAVVAVEAVRHLGQSAELGDLVHHGEDVFARFLTVCLTTLPGILMIQETH